MEEKLSSERKHKLLTAMQINKSGKPAFEAQMSTSNSQCFPSQCDSVELKRMYCDYARASISFVMRARLVDPSTSSTRHYYLSLVKFLVVWLSSPA